MRKPTEPGQSKNRPQITAGWGRSASSHRPGLFIKQHLTEHAEASAADVYRALAERIELLNKERITAGDQPLRRPNYSSFSRYVHWFLILGLIERTGKEAPASYDFLHKKVFLRLTNKGKSETDAWKDPIRASHPEFR